MCIPIKLSRAGCDHSHFSSFPQHYLFIFSFISFNRSVNHAILKELIKFFINKNQPFYHFPLEFSFFCWPGFRKLLICVKFVNDIDGIMCLEIKWHELNFFSHTCSSFFNFMFKGNNVDNSSVKQNSITGWAGKLHEWESKSSFCVLHILFPVHASLLSPSSNFKNAICSR